VIRTAVAPDAPSNETGFEEVVYSDAGSSPGHLPLSTKGSPMRTLASQHLSFCLARVADASVRWAAGAMVVTLALTLAGCGGARDGSAGGGAAKRADRVESTALALAANGAACTAASDCTSNFCTDGVCCDTACGGATTTDCQACSIAAGAAADGVCGARMVGASCSDGNACTATDLCAAGGVCAPGTATTCTALDQCHDVGICDPGTGMCSSPVKLNGSPCSDGNACTTADTCQAGLCTAGTAIICPAPDQCHEATTCNTSTGACVYPVKGDGTACTDNDACTGADTCQAGVCTGSAPVTCTAIDQCHVVGTCNPATGQCSHPIKGDGTPCSDGTVCTTGDVCMAGVCAGAALNCNDNNACTADVCIGSVGCANTLIPNCGMPPIDAASPDAGDGGAADAGDGGDAMTATDALVDAISSDTTTLDSAVDSKTDLAPADSGKGDAVTDSGKIDAKVDAPVDASAGQDASAPGPDATSASDARVDGKGPDAPIAVGGGGGCDCNLRGPRGAGTPMQAIVLVGGGLIWFVRRRRRS
jgi:hypothetical protein